MSDLPIGFFSKLTPYFIQLSLYLFFLLLCVRLRHRELAFSQKMLFAYNIIVVIIFINTNDMLEAFLGFGVGRNFYDIQHATLYGFWAGGLSVFVIQLLIWIEVFFDKRKKS